MTHSASTSIPSRLPAPFLDKTQYLISRIFVLQIHVDFRFGQKLSPSRLKKALGLVLDREPVLGCRFVPHPLRPFWERLSRQELDKADILTEASGKEAGTQAFLSAPLDGTQGPQLKALLIHENGKDRLIIKVNHQVTDAGGAKELGYLIAEIYRKLQKNPDYQPVPNLGERGMGQIFKRFSLWRLAKVLLRFVTENIALMVPLKNLVFPSGMETSGEIRFSFHRFPKDRVRAMVAHARKHGATLNDLFVAALFHAISHLAKEKINTTPRLVCTVDLRRYLPEKQAGALCNLSGFFVPRLLQIPGTDLDRTLVEVKRFIDDKKTKDMGLSFMLVDSLLTAPLPFVAFRALMKKIVDRIRLSENFPPALTNLGAVEEEALDFGGFHPISAEVLVPPTGPPFFALGLSGYKDCLTLSAGYDPAAISPQSLDELFQKLDSILPS